MATAEQLDIVSIDPSLWFNYHSQPQGFTLQSITTESLNLRHDNPKALTREKTSQSSIASPKTLSSEIPFVVMVSMAQFMTQVVSACQLPPSTPSPTASIPPTWGAWLVRGRIQLDCGHFHPRCRSIWRCVRSQAHVH